MLKLYLFSDEMFFTSDLLTVQGGRFANIWLLATSNKSKIIRYRSADFLLSCIPRRDTGYLVRWSNIWLGKPVTVYKIWYPF